MGAPQLLSTNLEGADSSIEVIVDEPIGVISPNIYGQFVENLSGVVYDGIWVGRSSKIPNENGIRRDLLDGLRQIRVPVIRFPGGCFADSYDWRDGVGPMTKRPRRTNFLGHRESARQLGSITNMIPISSVLMNSFGFVNSSARSPILPRMFEVFRRSSSKLGSNIATLRRMRQP